MLDPFYGKNIKRRRMYLSLTFAFSSLLLPYLLRLKTIKIRRTIEPSRLMIFIMNRMAGITTLLVSTHNVDIAVVNINTNEKIR